MPRIVFAFLFCLFLGYCVADLSRPGNPESMAIGVTSSTAAALAAFVLGWRLGGRRK